MCGCAWCPLVFCVALYEACAVTFKENYIVLFMEDDSINRGALILCERGTAPPGLLPAGLVLPVQSSLVTLI